MLRLVDVSSPDEKKKYFKTRTNMEDLWIVSHIEAKRWMQDHYLQTRQSVPTQTVLRAAEYWQWLFTINRPDWRIVSESLIYAFIEDWFNKNKILSPYNDIEMFYNLIVQIAPLLFSQQRDYLPEWLALESGRRERLSMWFELAQDFLEEFSKKKWVGRPWILSLLLEQTEIYFGDAEKVHIDLGLDLQHEEVDLILRLSREKDVSILCPKPSWQEDYKSSFSMYQRLWAAVDDRESLEPTTLTTGDSLISEEDLSSVHTQGEPSVLSEVKTVVAQVRSFLDKGVAPHQMAIGTSALEDYWPLLRAHFEREGVPVNKRVVARAISYPEVQIWLSQLQLLNEDFSQAALEASLYLRDEVKPNLPYREFKKNFSNLYDVKKIRNEFRLPPIETTQHQLSLPTFVDLLYRHWQGGDEEIMNEIVDRLVKDVSTQDFLPYSIWVKYLELIISRYEIPLLKEQNDGVQFLNLNAMDWTDADYLFLMGCEQKLLIQTQRTPLLLEDISAIDRDLGFLLSAVENNKLEFDLRWLLEKNQESVLLTHSESDFNGDPQLAAYDWIQRHHKTAMSLPHTRKAMEDRASSTRWDQLMEQPLQDIFHFQKWREKDSALVRGKILREHDLNVQLLVPLDIYPRLSASQLQKLDQCSFLFFAEKILKLQSTEEYDLEMDPLYNGQVLHALLEKLVIQFPSLQISAAELDQLYEETVDGLGEDHPMQHFWRHEKPRQLALIKSFIDLELEYRESHPGVRIAGTEVVVQGFLRRTDGGEVLWSQQGDNQSYPFLGKIDRLDFDANGNLGIIDYKTSQTESVKSFSSWIKNSQFQMSLYAQAVEAGLAANNINGPVVAAEYIFLKNKKRGSGFVLQKENSGFLGLEKTKTISEDEKQKHDQEISQKISQLLEKLKIGDFSAKPKDVKICEKCQWSPVCRAPHLL